MKLKRPLAFLDLETTGTDAANDRIVEIGIYVWRGEPVSHCWRVNPGIPIPKEASGVHGITDEMVANEPPFGKLAPFVHSILSGCDLAGFNVTSFDIPILWEEFARAGIEWDISKTFILDASNIFRKKERRTLVRAELKKVREMGAAR